MGSLSDYDDDGGGWCESTSCLKKMMIVFNVYYWFSGPACLGLGIWFVLIVHQLEPSLDPVEFSFSSYTMIAGGVAVSFYGLIGCIAIYNEHRCLLGFYYVLLATSFAAQLASCLKLFLLYDTIESHVNYNLNISIRYKYSSDHEMAEKLDSLQQEFSCCGVRNYTDWESSKYIDRRFSSLGHHSNISYPVSCYPERHFNTSNSTSWDDIQIFQKGCASPIVSLMKRYCKIFGWPTFGMSAMQVIGGVILYCFRTALR